MMLHRFAPIALLAALPFGWLSYREHERRDALAATVHHPDVQDAGHPPLPPQEPERPARLN